MLARSGYERGAVSAVALHLEADQGHALEGFEALDRVSQAVPSALEIVAGVQSAEQGFDDFCAEICEASAPVAVGDVRSSLPT